MADESKSEKGMTTKAQKAAISIRLAVRLKEPSPLICGKHYTSNIHFFVYLVECVSLLYLSRSPNIHTNSSTQFLCYILHKVYMYRGIRNSTDTLHCYLQKKLFLSHFYSNHRLKRRVRSRTVYVECG